MRRIHAEGHELALHSWTHKPLTEELPARLRTGLSDSRERLQDLCGAPVVGFRAPVFSLTPASVWAVEVLAELGFHYSSSVLPGRNPLYSFPGAPRQPFRWPCGLVELPVPLIEIGRLTLPLLGGIYLRYLPPSLVSRWRAALPPGTLPWSYVHPYDIDAEEPYFRFPGTSFWMSVLLWRRRTCPYRSASPAGPITSPGR